MRLVIAALVLAMPLSTVAESAGGGHGHSAAGGRGHVDANHPTPLSASPRSGSSHGNSMRQEMRRGEVPPLDPSRRVLEHDCTKPFDPVAGNLRCRQRNSVMKSAGRIFLTGVLTVLPVLATFYFALWMLTAVEWFFGQQLKWLMPDQYYRAGMGLALAIVLIFVVGLLMHALVFRRIFGAAEHLLLEIPILRSVYAAVRDLFGLVTTYQQSETLRVVAITLPGTQMRLLGFVSRADFEGLPESVGHAGEVAVYLPMSYQIGGYMLLVPRELLIPVRMSREEAMKFILTAGLKSARNSDLAG
jgi:uncharacterized membrane protein